MKFLRGTWDWHVALFAVVVVGVIIVASIGLVRYSNRDRGAAQAIVWAAEALRDLPDSVVAAVFDPGIYAASAARFADAVKENSLPVDSLRAFYERYALWARDGRIDQDEMREIGLTLGVAPVKVIRESDAADSTAPAAIPDEFAPPPFGSAAADSTGEARTPGTGDSL